MTRYCIELNHSTRSGKKYMATIHDTQTGTTKTVHFGALGYEDYTIHHDENRKANYMNRHQHDHVDDIYAAGFWSMRLLWNKPTILESAQDISDDFDADIEVNI